MRADYIEYKQQTSGKWESTLQGIPTVAATDMDSFCSVTGSLSLGSLG